MAAKQNSPQTGGVCEKETARAESERSKVRAFSNRHTGAEAGRLGRAKRSEKHTKGLLARSRLPCLSAAATRRRRWGTSPGNSGRSGRFGSCCRRFRSLCTLGRREREQSEGRGGSGRVRKAGYTPSFRRIFARAGSIEKKKAAASVRSSKPAILLSRATSCPAFNPYVHAQRKTGEKTCRDRRGKLEFARMFVPHPLKQW